MTQDRRNGEKTHEAPLESLLQELEIESAPASLTSRLYRIPQEQAAKARKWPWQRISFPAPRWVMAPAFAAVPVLVLALFLFQERQPSAAEIEQARQDLVVAFAYLDKAGVRTGIEIQDILGNGLRHGVKDPLSEHLPYTESIRKEETT